MDCSRETHVKMLIFYFLFFGPLLAWRPWAEAFKSNKKVGLLGGPFGSVVVSKSFLLKDDRSKG